MDDYRDRMKAYRAQELPKRIQNFETCATPTEEAQCDASLFLRKYFLDEDGTPDRTKTPHLILLPGYNDKSLALTGRTQRIPALHVADGGLGGANNVMVVGWDRSRVNNEAHQIDMQQSAGCGVLRSSHDWDQQMMSHLKYAKKRCNQAESLNPKAGSSFKPHNVSGKYVMKCEAIQHDRPALSKQLHLRMISNGRLAIFDFGIVMGLMVLGKTQEDVTRLVQDGKWNADTFDAEDSDDEGEREDASSDEEESDDERASGRSDQPAKRRKIESSHPRRLHFQWRGYNTISGVVQFDPQNRNTGYLDFANDDATRFEGNILMDAMGSEISFQGYKVPGMAGPLTMDWNARKLCFRSFLCPEIAFWVARHVAEASHTSDCSHDSSYILKEMC